MQIKKFGSFTFVCTSRSNRSGFVHECTMFNESNRELAFSKAQYYNRTRERFTYESVIEDCLWNYRMKNIERAIDDYKYENNVKKLSEEKKQKIRNDFDYSELGQKIQNARDEVAAYNGF